MKLQELKEVLQNLKTILRGAKKKKISIGNVGKLHRPSVLSIILNFYCHHPIFSLSEIWPQRFTKSREEVLTADKIPLQHHGENPQSLGKKKKIDLELPTKYLIKCDQKKFHHHHSWPSFILQVSFLERTGDGDTKKGGIRAGCLTRPTHVIFKECPISSPKIILCSKDKVPQTVSFNALMKIVRGAKITVSIPCNALS